MPWEEKMWGVWGKLGQTREGCLEEVRLYCVTKVEFKEAKLTTMETMFPAERMAEVKVWR